MINSEEISTNITCYFCDNEVETSAWIIIDIEERPDLLQKIRESKLNHVDCPTCHRNIEIDLPPEN